MDSEMIKLIKNGIWQAIQNVLPKAIKTATFDKTIEGRIIESLGGGLYSVSIDGYTYKVPSIDKSASYGVNDIVKVVVQQNDYNKLYIPVQSSSVQVPTAEAVQANLEEHENNIDIHTSASEKAIWNSKLSSNSDGSNLTNTFSAATSRANLTTGEKISASLGKIAKWFSDLKNVAFSGSYNDLSNKPSIPSALSDLSDDASHRTVTDTEKSIWNSKQNVLSGDITTHYHSSDRSRANHTGTQTASTISDFDDAVSETNDVSANTNARHTHSNKMVLDNTTASYTTAEQTKLSEIESGANKYIHPTGDGNSHVPVTGTTNGGKVLTAGSTANSASWAIPTVAWGNVSSKPSSSVSAIDSAVKNSHTHANKTILDATTASYITDEKTKLSGIENGATADMTASEILTAIKTVDGSGSGLDADLLDGKQASDFATSAQGMKADNALPSSSYNASDVLAKLKTVDGSGSGIDSDLLDGHESSNFAPIASPAFTGTPTAPTPITGTNTDQLATTKFVQSSLSAGGYGDMLKATYDTDNDGVIDNAKKLNGLSSGNESSNIPISNGIINTNLNSDLLDGNDSSFYKNIQVSSTQPSNQRAGDLWFQVV